MQARGVRGGPRGVKVPAQITVLFWAIKLASTALGESTSDYLVHRFNPYVAVACGFVAFVVALGRQLSLRRYVPAVYWLAVVMVAVFGTMAADVVHIEFGVPYVVSTVAFALALAVVFTVWHRVEGTLSFHSVATLRRELFYWAAVVTTFAMGTAAGDLAAYTLNLGFLTAGLVFAAVFALPALGWRFLGWNAIFAFWFAYVMTRPFGASFADWTGKGTRAGGLGWGDGPVAFALAAAIVLLVVAATRADRTRSETPAL